jgi:hypothetical protein
MCCVVLQSRGLQALVSLRHGSQAVTSLTHGFPRLAAQSQKKPGLGTQKAKPRCRLSGRAGPADHYLYQYDLLH